MKRFSVQLVSLTAVLLISVAAADGTHVDFRNDITPIFTKYGCNAGACHGAAIGRGGFKLSLYGGNPEADYDTIVRQVHGRRVNLAKPEKSLIFLKPAEYVEHGGGNVFAADSESAHLLIHWIKQGAKKESQHKLTRVEITPERHVDTSLGAPVTLRAIAHYSNGSSRDVTRWTIFAAEDASAVSVDAVSAMARVLRRGRHIVVARYLSEVVPIELVVPLTDAQVNLASEARNNFIDEEVLESLQTLGLRPSPTVDDATFLRRLSLDLTGRAVSTDFSATQTRTSARRWLMVCWRPKNAPSSGRCDWPSYSGSVHRVETCRLRGPITHGLANRSATMQATKSWLAR